MGKLEAGLRAGTLGTAARLLDATLLLDAPPRSGRERDLWIFRRARLGPFDRLIADAAQVEGLDPFLLKGLLDNESRLDPNLIGKRQYGVVRGKRRLISGGARGIAQITSAGIDAVNELWLRRGVARPFTPSDAMNPERAVPAAAALLADYIDRYGRDGGITAYNTGPSGGRLVRDQGFGRAARDLALQRSGHVLNQGVRFLPNVLRRTNRWRSQCGLAPLPPIGAARPERRPSS